MDALRNVPLASKTTLGVGGCAEYFVEVHSEAELSAALSWAKQQAQEVSILAGGSNVVVSDQGVRGLVVQMALRGVAFEPAGDHCLVTACAAESLDALVERCCMLGLSGLEGLSGIPGTVGATPIQNVGAYGQEIADHLEQVTVLDRISLQRCQLTRDECGFGYRSSRFKSDWSGRYVVLSVQLRLPRCLPSSPRSAELQQRFSDEITPPTSVSLRQWVLELRRKKSMLFDALDPNSRGCGSFFVNPIVPHSVAEQIRASSSKPCPAWELPEERTKLAAGWLIEQAGVERGFRLGAAGLSRHHALALIAHEGATADDVLRVAHHVRARVHERFAVQLEPEPHFWGFGPLSAGLPALPV